MKFIAAITQRIPDKCLFRSLAWIFSMKPVEDNMTIAIPKFALGVA
jgi:hypothetical protein